MATDRIAAKQEAQVYAQVLLDAAKTEDKVFQLTGQFEDFLSVLRGSIDLHTALTDNAISPEERMNIVKGIFTNMDAALLGVLNVVFERNDTDKLARICEDYTALAEEELSASIIDVTTVIELDDNLRDQIKTKYSAQLGRGVLLREHIDKGLIGGIVLNMHGKRIDASVAGQLERARVTLSSTGGK
jgi:F-type H+-transporting ATPase subunit delta